MPAYNGKALVCSWVHSAGTVVMEGKYRNADYKPAVDLLDQSGGADTNKSYIADLKDGTWSVSGLLMSGTGVGGTLMTTPMVEGAVGTLIVGPEGTAAGKFKITTPCVSLGVATKLVYNALTEYAAEFQQNGTRVEGTY
jgi:hypothetical protein